MSLYEELGLASNATLPQIKKAYRDLALTWHPDKNPPDGGERFQRIRDAYEVLSDRNRRHIYDANRMSSLSSFRSTHARMARPFVPADDTNHPCPSTQQWVYLKTGIQWFLCMAFYAATLETLSNTSRDEIKNSFNIRTSYPSDMKYTDGANVTRVDTYVSSLCEQMHTQGKFFVRSPLVNSDPPGYKSFMDFYDENPNPMMLVSSTAATAALRLFRHAYQTGSLEKKSLLFLSMLTLLMLIEKQTNFLQLFEPRKASAAICNAHSFRREFIGGVPYVFRHQNFSLPDASSTIKRVVAGIAGTLFAPAGAVLNVLRARCRRENRNTERNFRV